MPSARNRRGRILLGTVRDGIAWLDNDVDKIGLRRSGVADVVPCARSFRGPIGVDKSAHQLRARCQWIRHQRRATMPEIVAGTGRAARPLPGRPNCRLLETVWVNVAMVPLGATTAVGAPADRPPNRSAPNRRTRPASFPFPSRGFRRRGWFRARDVASPVLTRVRHRPAELPQAVERAVMVRATIGEVSARDTLRSQAISPSRSA